MLVNLGTERVNKNRIKEKTGGSLCLQRISYLLSLMHVLLYGSLIYGGYTVSCILRID